MGSLERQQQREALLEELRQMGEFHRGTVNIQYRKCGKAGCGCARKAHPGHGPQATLTYKQAGKTTTRNLPSEAAVRLTREQIERHRRFRDWSHRWVQLNEELCHERLDQLLQEEPGAKGTPEKKRRSSSSRRFVENFKP
mgnify:CR=1 FL=1